MGKRIRSIVGRVLGALLALVLLSAVIVGLTYRQDISDHLRASAFDPSPRVTQILDDLQLTARGERIFLASKPTVDGSQHFNSQCAGVDHSDEGHVLGCFSEERIRLFDVTDERISGIVEVTAAHELLHAAYSRLSSSEREDLERELQSTFDDLSSHDEALKERMAVYDHLSPSAYANELHSVLGTETRDLPEHLEKHYAKYFSDRASLLERFDEFRTVFTDLETQAASLEAEMTTLRTDIEQRNAEYDAQVQQFNSDAADFTARNSRFEFSDNGEEFERIRADLRDRRAFLESTLNALQADINYYNSLRDQLRDLGQVSTELDALMNSSLAPVSDTPE